MLKLSVKKIENLKKFPEIEKILSKIFFHIEQVLKELYPDQDLTPLNQISIKLTKASTSYYHRINKRIDLSTKKTYIMFYPRKKCGYITPYNGLYLKQKYVLESELLHEYIHGIQHLITKSKFSEAETTNAQIYHLKKYYPSIFKKLKKLPSKLFSKGDYVYSKKYKIKSGFVEKSKIEYEGRTYDVKVFSYYHKKIEKTEVIYSIPQRYLKSY